MCWSYDPAAYVSGNGINRDEIWNEYVSRPVDVHHDKSKLIITYVTPENELIRSHAFEVERDFPPKNNKYIPDCHGMPNLKCEKQLKPTNILWGRRHLSVRNQGWFHHQEFVS